MGEKTKTCPQCNHDLPRTLFGISPRLVHGLTSWCIKCLGKLSKATGAKGADLKLAFQRDYARAYAACRRQLTNLREKFLITDPTTGDRVGLTRMVKDDIVRLAGPWRLYRMSEALLLDNFKADSDSVAVIGRGGGRGNRKQKWFRVEGYVEPDAWDVGMIVIREEWVVQEVKKLGKLS